MPSDSNGLYSLPAGYLAVTGQTILASQHNPPLEDIADGLTARLMRSGVAPMTGVLRITDGAVGAPALALASAPTWGLYKTATGWGVAVSGANVLEANPTATILPAGLTVAGNATVSKTLLTHDGGDIASASALTLGDGNVFNITGTTAITSIGTKGVGTLVWLRFNGVLTLTHHATNLILITAANITTAAGDWGLLEEYGSGTWRMLSFNRANGTTLGLTVGTSGATVGLLNANKTDSGTNTFSGPNTFSNAAGIAAKNTIKASGYVTISAGTPTLVDSFNVTSVTKNGTGDWTITFTNAMANANYHAVATSNTAGGALRMVTIGSQTTTTLQILGWNVSASSSDPVGFSFHVTGA